MRCKCHTILYTTRILRSIHFKLFHLVHLVHLVHLSILSYKFSSVSVLFNFFQYSVLIKFFPILSEQSPKCCVHSDRTKMLCRCHSILCTTSTCHSVYIIHCISILLSTILSIFPLLSIECYVFYSYHLSTLSNKNSIKSKKYSIY